MQSEFESERIHHQKMLRDYARLQQRLENIQSDMRINQPNGSNFLSRSPSNVSNVSVESESSGEKNEAVNISLAILHIWKNEWIDHHHHH